MQDSDNVFDDLLDEQVSPSTGVSSTSISLLIRAQTSDNFAWHKLVALYGPLVFQWCNGRGVNPSDTEDVVQEVFSSVARSLPDFQRDGKGSFRCWLKAISNNRLADYFRQMKRVPVSVQIEQLVSTECETPSNDLESEEENTVFLNALKMIEKDFPKHIWQAFWNSTVLGHDPATVADELQISRNVVYLARSRVLRRFRQEFNDLMG